MEEKFKDDDKSSFNWNLPDDTGKVFFDIVASLKARCHRHVKPQWTQKNFIGNDEIIFRSEIYEFY